MVFARSEDGFFGNTSGKLGVLLRKTGRHENSHLKKAAVIALIVLGAFILAYLISVIGPGKASGNQQFDSLFDGPGSSAGEASGSYGQAGGASNQSASSTQNSSSTSVTANSRYLR